MNKKQKQQKRFKLCPPSKSGKSNIIGKHAKISKKRI
jgi:hypothetical protein